MADVRILKLVVSIAASMMLIASCKNHDRDEFPVGQYLFEIEYQNFAWSPSYHGLVVHRNGEVWSYNVITGGGGAAQPGEEVGEPIPASQLDTKFALGAVFLEDHGDGLVDRFRSSLPLAFEASLSESVTTGADMGRCQGRIWRYDSANDTYTFQLVRQVGDQLIENDSEAAQEILVWLETLPGSCLGLSGLQPAD